MSTDSTTSVTATLAAAPDTAHCAYDYAQLDVFAENPLEGNALAVFYATHAASRRKRCRRLPAKPI